MRFTGTDIPGVMLVAPEPVADPRGHFARWYCADEFSAHGLELPDSQGGLSRNIRRGTLRGLHWIPEAEGESKLVRCLRGRVFDVVVDLRPASARFGAWTSAVLDAESSAAFFIPRGCAHGFLTLEDDTDVGYQFSMPHRPGIEGGVRWDDPTLAIAWPDQPIVMSDRDAALPFLLDLGLTADAG